MEEDPPLTPLLMPQAPPTPRPHPPPPLSSHISSLTDVFVDFRELRKRHFGVLEKANKALESESEVGVIVGVRTSPRGKLTRGDIGGREKLIAQDDGAPIRFVTDHATDGLVLWGISIGGRGVEGWWKFNE